MKARFLLLPLVLSLGSCGVFDTVKDEMEDWKIPAAKIEEHADDVVKVLMKAREMSDTNDDGIITGSEVIPYMFNVGQGFIKLGIKIANED